MQVVTPLFATASLLPANVKANSVDKITSGMGSSEALCLVVRMVDDVGEVNR